MRLSRSVPALAAATVLAASVAPASAATPGVGATQGTLSVLSVDAGDLVQIDLLNDEGKATTTDARSASAFLSALHVASDTLGIDQTTPLLQASSTDGEDTASQPATAIPANLVLGGQILPAQLTALVGADGASSTIGAGVVDLNVLSGLLGLQSSALSLGAGALGEQANGTRSLSIDELSVLDLSSLLDGLGIPLTDLSLDTILGLIDGLGLLPQLGSALNALDLPVDLDLGSLSTDSVNGLIDQITAVPNAVTGLSGADGTTVCQTVGSVLGGLLGSDPTTVCTDLTGTVNQVTAQLPDLQATVDALLGQALDTILGVLDGSALLSLSGLDVSMVTTATDSLETSVADVTATLGDLQVGALDLGALDLQGAVGQVSSVLGTVQSTLGGVLGQIHPSLANLVTVSALDDTTSVTEEAGTIVSKASFTGLGIDIAPLDLSAVLASLSQVTSIGDQLTAVGVDPTSVLPVSGIAGLNDALSAATGTNVFALTDGMSLRVASMSQASTFAAQATPATPAAPGAPDLPRTGSDDARMLLFAAVAAAGALGLRRLLRPTR